MLWVRVYLGGPCELIGGGLRLAELPMNNFDQDFFCFFNMMKVCSFDFPPKVPRLWFREKKSTASKNRRASLGLRKFGNLKNKN